MNSKSDTVDAEIQLITSQLMLDVKGIVNKYNNPAIAPKTMNDELDEAYHETIKALQALLLRERELGKIEVLERLMTSDPKWTYDAAKDILIDSRDELSRLSKGVES